MITLLVEDDIDLAATIVDYLATESIECDHAANGRAGLNLVTTNRYEALIVDVSMPGLDGLNLCQQLRAAGRDVPVLMLTARDSLGDKLAGFDAGADDYLTKPFDIEELVARLRALAGRRSGNVRHRHIGGLVIDFDRHHAARSGRTLELTPTGWRMLALLARRSPETVAYDQLFEAGWGDDPPSRNSFNVQLHKLRKALVGAEEPDLLHTVAGVGIRLEADAD
ncbi:MAG: response regulator transcription factor [Pseudomonadota bacterium]